MISTVLLLLTIGIKSLRKSIRLDISIGKIFSFGLISIAIAIVFYAIGDIFTQMERYDIQSKLLYIGSFFHLSGILLLFWFLVKEFTEERFRKVFMTIGIFLVLSITATVVMVQTEREIIQAQFEPFSYNVVRQFPDSSGGFLGEAIVASIYGIFLICMIIYNAVNLREKKLKNKLIVYGMGFLFLSLFTVVCTFFSPIFARAGYLLGAIFLYWAYFMKKQVE